MNRISVVGGIFILFLIALIFSCRDHNASGNKSFKSPNIIYIMADDLAVQAIGAYGSIYKDLAPTPNIDQLAAEGMLFNDVLCTNAICGPSRASILTGDYSHTHQYFKNESGGKFNADLWTFPQEFKKNGYTTSLFGKWHLGSEPVGFDHYIYHAASGQQGLYWNPVYNHNGTKREYKGYATNLTTNFALEWLENNAKEENPFLMLLQFKAPHRPWDPDSIYQTLWDDIEMPYPTTFDDNYEGRELTAGDTDMTMDFLSNRDMKLPIPLDLKNGEKIRWQFYGAKRGEIVQPENMTNEEGKKWRYQRYIKDYLACVKSVDDNVGKVLAYLKEKGLEENTIIVLTSDQGFYLGDHGFFDKRFIYEESIKMPFIMKYPDKIKGGSINNDIIGNIDFAPTLLELAEIKVEVPIQGKSFAQNILSGKNGSWKTDQYYHYYEFPYWHHVQPHYGLRNGRYTLAHFYYNIDVWELYDRKKDPEQLKNLVADQAYSNILSELKQRLNVLRIETKDTLSIEETRKITDTDYGEIVEKNSNEVSVKNIVTNSK